MKPIENCHRCGVRLTDLQIRALKAVAGGFGYCYECYDVLGIKQKNKNVGRPKFKKEQRP